MGTTQIINGIDEITPFHEGLAAIRSGNSWGFINSEGEKVIDFRNDLVENPAQRFTNRNYKNYPYFSDGRCLIKEVRDDITYYGYIDKNGEVIIKANYLNATPFDNELAIVIKYYKEKINASNLLQKEIVMYSYVELLIDTNEQVKEYLRGPVNLLFTSKKLKKPPAIKSQLLTNDMVAVKTNNGTLEIYKIKD